MPGGDAGKHLVMRDCSVHGQKIKERKKKPCLYLLIPSLSPTFKYLTISQYQLLGTKFTASVFWGGIQIQYNIPYLDGAAPLLRS